MCAQHSILKYRVPRHASLTLMLRRGPDRTIAVTCPFVNLVELRSSKFSGKTLSQRLRKRVLKLTHDIDLLSLHAHVKMNEHVKNYILIFVN